MNCESNREYRDRVGIAKMFHLFDAQEKETTKTMLRFESGRDDKYSIRIVDESHGYLTCTIRLRVGGTLLYCLRFKKAKKQGVIYNFWDAVRLNRLYVEEELFPELLLPLPVSGQSGKADTAGGGA
jgi:hypothetical protein